MRLEKKRVTFISGNTVLGIRRGGGLVEREGEEPGVETLYMPVAQQKH